MLKAMAHCPRLRHLAAHIANTLAPGNSARRFIFQLQEGPSSFKKSFILVNPPFKLEYGAFLYLSIGKKLIFKSNGYYFLDVSLAEVDAFLETETLSFRERVMLTAMFQN